MGAAGEGEEKQGAGLGAGGSGHIHSQVKTWSAMPSRMRGP